MVGRMRNDLDIALIGAFLAVVEAGGVTRAAASLGVSQAAASQQIKRLEDALDCRLFEREGRRLVLGPAGERLLAQARRLLALNDEVWSSMRTPSFEGEVRLGVPYDIIANFVPAILRRFAKAQPRVRVSLVCEASKVGRGDLRIPSGRHRGGGQGAARRAGGRGGGRARAGPCRDRGGAGGGAAVALVGARALRDLRRQGGPRGAPAGAA